MRKISTLLLVLLFFLSCNGQETTTYLIGTIPNLDKFEQLTEHEKDLNQRKEKYDAERLKMIRDSKERISYQTKELQQQSLDYEETILKKKYAENRSRYFIRSYTNDVLAYNSSKDVLTTECDCYLSQDSIYITMGIWAFGGFGFPAIITKTDFKASYWEDMHKKSVYKKNLSDSVTSETIGVEFEKIKLTLKKQPAFVIGEHLTGYMQLKTHPYYRKEDEYSDRFDKEYIEGEVYFKCKIRKKIFVDEQHPYSLGVNY